MLPSIHRLLILGLLATAPLALADPITRVANTTLTLPAEAPVEGDYTVENAFGSLTFSNPIAIATPPGETGFTYVVERGGKVQRVNLSNNTKSEFLNLSSWLVGQGTPLSQSLENGLLSMAFHPNYNQNGYFYAFYSLSISNQIHQRIARFTATGTPGNYLAATTSNPTTHQALITQRDQANNHNGGDMHFGADGYLYISVGDEGAANDDYNNANFINKDFFSAILRIDVDQKAGNLTPNNHSQSNSSSHPSAVHAGTYKIPADNPFIGVTSHQGNTIAANTVRTEIWVTGLRNPWRFSFDSPTGRCFIGDVGQGKREEINLVSGGEDCGWSRREGFIPFTSGPAGSSVPSGYSPHDPIYDYPRSDGRSLTGGLVYRGSRLGELFGRYIFADYATGKVWNITEQSNGTWTREDLISQGGVVSFGEDPRNKDLLLCAIADGKVYRLVRSTNTNPAPLTLSATGAFSNLSNLTPAAGIYAYDINHPFWSDFATKRRWFSIPQLSDTVGYSDSVPWAFPTGQVWIKHFDLEMERGNAASSRPLETRFIVKTTGGIYGLTYRWRADGSDADLVGSNGLDEDLTIIDGGNPVTQTWNYPSRTDCLSCHTPDAGHALSFNVRQLNRSGALGGDQLACLAASGFLDSTPAPSKSLPAHPALNDSQVSRESRIRTYLEVNCAMCHRGSASTVPGNFDARITTKTDLAEIINGMLVDNLGNGSNRFIVPNDLTHSVVLKRLDGSAGRMPPLASNETDQEAIDLLTQWITGELPSRLSYTEWAQANFGTTGTANTIENGDFDNDGQSNITEYLAGTDGSDISSTFALILGETQFSFIHPANRSVLIESSSDLINWQPFDHMDNNLTPPATDQNKTFNLPAGDKLFLRARLSQP
ncbi:hypothetical protein NT6N_27250 [Oceaniferula spumae]|uniref:Glucose/Sorbosone dehydrogenase domain-containing protein n=1 Tax=Oceaniferula spumae TaxID=2979115 RepID=A0AAT9FP06_9BACT